MGEPKAVQKELECEVSECVRVWHGVMCVRLRSHAGKVRKG